MFNSNKFYPLKFLIKYLRIFPWRNIVFFFPREHYPLFLRENCSSKQLSLLPPQGEDNFVPFSSREKIRVGRISNFCVSKLFNPLDQDITFFIFNKIQIWVQARYFVHTCYLVFYLKIIFQTFNLPLAFQNEQFFQFFSYSFLTCPQVPCQTQKGSTYVKERKQLELGAAPSFQH